MVPILDTHHGTVATMERATISYAKNDATELGEPIFVSDDGHPDIIMFN